jgi:cytochrome c-type biogenesis protein CcmH/NrfG
MIGWLLASHCAVDGLLDNRFRFCQTLFGMLSFFSNPPVANGKRGIQFRPILLITAAVLAVGVVWLSSRFILQRSLTKKIPALPDLVGFHQSLRDQLLRLDAEVRTDPRSVQKIIALGLTYHANDSFQEARSCYQLAIGLAPMDYRWWYYLAIVEEMQGDEDHAIKLLRRVTELQPGYVHAWARMGNLLRRSSRVEEAKNAFFRARNLEPLHPYTCLGLARISAGAEDWNAVAEILEPMLKVHPLFAPALRLLSRACIQLGRRPRFEEAQDPKVPIEEVMDEPLLDALYEHSALALIQGKPDCGKLLLQNRCSHCHTTVRIQQADKSPLQWLHTVGRMQKQAGREWLNDSDAADILSYLIARPPLSTVVQEH